MAVGGVVGLMVKMRERRVLALLLSMVKAR